MVLGIGNVDCATNENGKRKSSYTTWVHIIQRCYDPKRLEEFNSYAGCSVCDEWKYFSKFDSWFNSNYREGFQLDKDIIKQGNKIYCPDFCRYVPLPINILLTHKKKKKSNLPTGVTFSKQTNTYTASYRNKGQQLKFSGFKTSEEAHKKYIELKEKHIKSIANEYFSEGLIGDDIYLALLKYKIN